MGDASERSSADPVIFITGFGPFSTHQTNASQTIVENLINSGLEAELGVKLKTEILEVDYLKAKEIIPKRWDEHNPKLVVHIGVSGVADVLTLEQLAYNEGYETQDICDCLPLGKVCVTDGESCITSGINMNKISAELNQKLDCKLPCVVSTDPGQYLCGFAYYISLHLDKKRCCFIHVPTLDKCSASITTLAVKEAIKSMWKQIQTLDADIS